MKILATFLLCLSSIIGHAQMTGKYIMIDRKLKQPLQFTDTITEDQMKKGFFVVEKANIDSLISTFEKLSARLRKIARENVDEVDLNVGNTLLNFKTVRRMAGDRLNVALSTDIGEGHKHKVYIADATLTNNDNAKYLNKLIAYIKKGML